MPYRLRVVFHCKSLQPGQQAMSLRGVSSGLIFSSAAEAIAKAEVLAATCRLTGGWNPILDGLTDLPAGSAWSYDLIRGIDRVEVRDDAGAVIELAMVVFGPTLVWTEEGSRELAVLLGAIERANIRAAHASDNRRAERYRAVALKLHAAASLRGLIAITNHIERDRAR